MNARLRQAVIAEIHRRGNQCFSVYKNDVSIGKSVYMSMGYAYMCARQYIGSGRGL